MRPLGKNQLSLLKFIGVSRALVVANKEAISLTARGLLTDDGKGSFYHITPAGLRALADEAEAGRVMLWEPPLPATPTKGAASDV